MECPDGMCVIMVNSTGTAETILRSHNQLRPENPCTAVEQELGHFNQFPREDTVLPRV
jgi:hypothetical protein